MEGGLLRNTASESPKKNLEQAMERGQNHRSIGAKAVEESMRKGEARPLSAERLGCNGTSQAREPHDDLVGPRDLDVGPIPADHKSS